MLAGNLEVAKQMLEDGEASEHVQLKWGVEGLGVASMLAEDAETEREVIRSRVDLRNTPQRNTAVIEQIDKRAFVVHVVGEVKGCAVVLQGTTGVACAKGASHEIRRECLATPREPPPVDRLDQGESALAILVGGRGAVQQEMGFEQAVGLRREQAVLGEEAEGL